jgi:hypothetical protein
LKTYQFFYSKPTGLPAPLQPVATDWTTFFIHNQLVNRYYWSVNRWLQTELVFKFENLNSTDFYL